MTFEFATATRILFGNGKRNDVFAGARRMGSRALIVTGRNSERAQWLVDGFRADGINTHIFTIPSEPTLARVEEGRRLASECGFVVAIGGGSAIDGGKAI